jgi:TRAP transporter TAXI family solute receptor
LSWPFSTGNGMRRIARLILTIMAISGMGLTPANAAPEYPDCPNTAGYCIATGNRNFTYFQIGKELSERVASDAHVSLLPIEGDGSPDNVERMRYQNGVKFAIVQSDVLLYYRKLVEQGNQDAKVTLAPLRVVQPLYNEEVHILARIPDGNPDGGLHYIHELENKRIAVGPSNGGSAMTALLAYQLMFGTLPSDDKVLYSSLDDAMAALASNKVDAFIMVVGQPAARFSSMPPSAHQYVRLLTLDPANAATRKLLEGPYYEADIKAESYPWLDRDVHTFTTKAYLISQVYTNPDTRRNVQNLTRAFCRRLGDLQQNGHPKWKQVSISRAPLPGGWQYSDDVMQALDSPDCRASAVPPGRPVCTVAERVLKVAGCSP